MHIQIDQSGRIESLTQNTVLSFANKISYSIFIHRREKRECLRVLNQRYSKLSNWPLKIFAACLFLLIQNFIDNIKFIVIDVEYDGRGGDIKGMLLRHIRKIKPVFSKDSIVFQSIGKKSKAHLIAYGVYKKQINPNKIIKAGDILLLL
ncbi:MAG: hypothetical protein AAB525_00120 [Patescibacteria group bacterium]